MANSNNPASRSDQITVSVIGLGYVGMPLAIALAKHVDVVAFDVSERAISRLMHRAERTQSIIASINPQILQAASFHIIAVPTPTSSGKPDLSRLVEACHALGPQLHNGAVVAIESTVYPGVAEKICCPILENTSGLRCGLDFKIAYCPERVNVGDTEHSFDQVCKVISGIDAETIERVMDIYGLYSPVVFTSQSQFVMQSLSR